MPGPPTKRTATPAAFAQALLAVLRTDGGLRPSLSKLPFLPIILFAILCYRSFPFAWHFRIFKPAWPLFWERILARLRSLHKPRKHDAILQKLVDARSPIGLNPFDWLVTYKTWASPDDCDYRLHLSNSSYPKVIDEMRFKAAVSLHPAGFFTGGWIALAGTHHHFVREIPVFQPYEVRMGMAAWDHKWVYITARFVSYPKKGYKHHQLPRSSIRAVDTATSPTELSGGSTPFPGASTASSSTLPNGANSAIISKIAEAAARTPEPDGATLHCVAVSLICFKIGRITVPPVVVFAIEGFSAPPPQVGELVDGVRVQPYSLSNPPPHYVKHAKALRAVGNHDGLVKFLRGGWKDVPESERWWEEALAPLEEERLRNLEKLEGLRTAMEAVRQMA